MSISESLLSLRPTEYTEKQRKQLEVFDSLISQEGIELVINGVIDFGMTPIAVDVEHDEQGNLVGIGACHRKICGYWTQITPELTRQLLQSEIIGHNGVSDMEMLRFWGIEVKDHQLVHDTMLVGHLLDSSLKSYGLKDMAKRDLGIIYPSYDDIVGKRGLKAPRITLDKQPLELTAKYNSLDTYCTWKLYERQKKACENL